MLTTSKPISVVLLVNPINPMKSQNTIIFLLYLLRAELVQSRIPGFPINNRTFCKSIFATLMAES